MSSTLPVTGNITTTHPENRAFFPALDGLRAIAFVMVFLQHYYAFPWGFTGVNVFFVLSGFLITGILFDSQDAPHRARTFYLRRTFRIFPLYYAFFLGLLLLQPIMHWKWSIIWIAWPLYLGNFLRYTSHSAAIPNTQQQLAADGWLYSQRSHSVITLGHFWSLCVEEQFYLVWPWIVFWVRSRRALIWICSIIVIAAPFARMIVQGSVPAWMLKGVLLYRFTPLQLDSLLLGGLIALLWRGEHRELLLKIGRAVASITAIIALIYCVRTFHINHTGWRQNYSYPTWRLTWGLTFVNILSAATILSVLRPTGTLFRALCWKPMRWLGRISYGAYVLHDLFHSFYASFCYRVTLLLAPHAGPDFSFVIRHEENLFPIFAFAATMVLAWASFRFLEAPFLRLKDRFAPPIA